MAPRLRSGQAPPLHAAVDLGAGSGRVLVGGFADRATVEEAYRFTYPPRESAGHLRWDFDRLLDGIHTGLRRAAAIAAREGRPLSSIGVDSWGVDYGLIDRSGRLIEDPICYRDARTAGMVERACARMEREVIFRETGIQFLPFNTIFQLMAHAEAGLPAAAERLLMIPDLCHNALCGSSTGETTNASTTGLLNIRTGEWAAEIFESLNLPLSLMPPLRRPGTVLGCLRDDLRNELHLPDVAVVQPATHDTASAVAGTPLHPRWAFISSGTWSLVGVERTEPLVGAPVLAANFTNERGANGTFRFLKNVAGLWILESCRREWRAAGLDEDLTHLIEGAAALPRPAGFVYPDAQSFFNPPSMVDALHSALAESGQCAPQDRISLTRICLDSLALRYASVISATERLTGERVEGIHIVGGGAQNDYLNQATANATGRPVLAGPVEATGLGNLLVQAVACSVTSIAEGRRRITDSFPLRRFEPVDGAAWASFAAQYDAIEQRVGEA